MDAATPLIRVSTLTCPVCGVRKAQTMTPAACQYFYDCTGCQTLLKPKHVDCCVFCSFGDVPCPPIQQSAPSDAVRGSPRPDGRDVRAVSRRWMRSRPDRGVCARPTEAARRGAGRVRGLQSATRQMFYTSAFTTSTVTCDR